MAAPRSDRLHDALARIFEDGRDTRASWFALTGGETLFGEGDVADTLYLLRSGRLGVFRRDPDDSRPPQFVGVIRPGEPVGEMAMLAGTAHTADVVALRDCEILALPRDAFFEAARTEPDLMVELSRLMMQRARDQRSGGGEPSVFGFISARARPIRAFVERIAASIEGAGFSCQVIDQSALSSATEWFSRVEDTHDFVLYVAEQDEPAWAALCARQVDKVFVVGNGLTAPPNRPMPHSAVLDQRRTDLILLRDPRMVRPANTGVWLDAIQPGRWFQAVDGDQADADRMGRVITGTAVGVVMSGGGARAYAHIGVLRALHEAGVPIDFVGGASMGAIIAAGPALGWTQEQLEQRIQKAFVKSDPLSDITFPMLAMVRARKVDCLLEEAYGDIDMADLVRPFFAVSTNLTSGKIEVHRRGLMRRAMRATIAIPGLLPPVVIDGQVLVDGAVLKNLPAEVMRQMHGGPIIGVDMSQTRGVDADLVQHPPSIWRLIATGAWRRGPPIVSILMRSATLTTDADLESSRAATDLLIQPTPDGVDIRDWKGFDAGVAAGYRAAKDTLATLDGPVSGLRRRRGGGPSGTVGETAATSHRPGSAETPRSGGRRARKEKPAS
ncbi:MAG TPA: patatin-like phospholipase family protein [Brevundimonas sp.]|nr:patatin-like phospholipase family protein [Brevundimonas sp.]